MIRDIDASAGHRISHECSIIYEYLRQGAAIQSPPELIQKFQNLLQRGKSVDSRVSQALEKIIFAEREQFNTFLNQCFYLILDTWIDKPELLAFVSQLLNTLNIISQSRSYDRVRKQLTLLIRSYQQSDSYQRLEQTIAIIQPMGAIVNSLDNSLVTNESAGSSSKRKTPLISSYLIRYTFLYPYFLSELSAPNLVEHIKRLQSNRQQDFEIKLSKHIIYRFRLKQLAKMKMMAKGAGKIITKADNPSLLSERAFRVAMQQYVGKNKLGSTLLERSQLFVAENEYRQTYKVFKQDLYRFLVNDIKPRNNTYRFSNQLEQKMTEIFPQADNKPLNRTQMLQTCRQLYSFLIVDPTSNNNPARFAELIANLGTARVMMMLLKIILICPESKADLERKICIVAMHYQHQTVAKNPWLVKSLEHLLMAFSIYFGKVDVSIARSAVR